MVFGEVLLKEPFLCLTIWSKTVPDPSFPRAGDGFPGRVTAEETDVRLVEENHSYMTWRGKGGGRGEKERKREREREREREGGSSHV